MNPIQTPENSQLGKASAYVDQYDASLLFPLPRETKRREIGILRAMGAPRAKVRRVFLLQGAMVALFGSLLGCALAATAATRRAAQRA